MSTHILVDVALLFMATEILVDVALLLCNSDTGCLSFLRGNSGTG